MKADERHRLKTNELANWLGRVPDFGRKYGKWLIGAAVLVALIISVVLVIGWRKGARRAEAWDAIAQAGQTREPAARAEQFARVVKDYPDSETATTWALYSQALATQEQALAGWAGSPETRGRAEELYQRIINDRPYHAVLTPLAQVGLANLLLNGSEPDIDRARELLIKVHTNSKADMAVRQMAGAFSEQLANAEQVTFAPAPPPTTGPDTLRTPGIDIRVPVVPDGLPLVPRIEGDDSGEPGRN